jgi:hypothetical protein
VGSIEDVQRSEGFASKTKMVERLIDVLANRHTRLPGSFDLAHQLVTRFHLRKVRASALL